VGCRLQAEANPPISTAEDGEFLGKAELEHESDVAKSLSEQQFRVTEPWRATDHPKSATTGAWSLTLHALGKSPIPPVILVSSPHSSSVARMKSMF
jgi:copper(I)-binding protein